jgi:hypothetical protein
MAAIEHRRQMIWQVWVPLITSIVIVLILAILVIVGAVQGSSQVERWANISTVIVILPVLVSGLILLILVGGLAYGITMLLKKMPDWLLKAQLFMLHLALSIRRAADAATKPVFAANTLSARVSTLWRRFVRRSPARGPLR